MASIFDTVKVPNLSYNNFRNSKSNRNYFTASMGKLYPMFLQETIPGDKIKLQTTSLVRLQPKLAPAYEDLTVYHHFFKIPHRILMNDGDYEKLMTGGRTGTDFKNPPYLTFKQIYQIYNSLNNGGKSALFFTAFGNGSLWDYIGLPSINSAPNSAWNSNDYDDLDHAISLLPILAYCRVFSDYFRDPNLSDYEFEPLPAGKVDTSNLDKCEAFINKYLLLRNKCYRKDYFTSALPFTQRGSTEAFVPVTGELEATGQLHLDTGLETPEQDSYLVRTEEEAQSASDFPVGATSMENPVPTYYESGIGIKNASFLINELREAEAAQRYGEAEARGGYRLNEWIASIFGVRTSDARLQRAQFLGGSSQPVIISEVLANSNSKIGDVETPLGTMAGHGISLNSTKQFKTYTEEPCYILGIFSLVPMPVYSQGLLRMFTRLTRYDFYIPQFAHLGEQPILNKEIFFDLSKLPSALKPNETFGYTPRYADYKTAISQVHGDFRGNLAYWVNGRQFTGTPSLNEDFVSVPDLTSNFAVSSGDHYLVQVVNNVKLRSKMSYYGTPSLR